MVSHAGSIMSTFSVGTGGITLWEIMQGNRCKTKEPVEFGECILYLLPESEGQDKAGWIWEEGTHLGRRSRSEEYYAGTDT